VLWIYSYPAPSATHISSEPDGLRILTPSTHSFLRKVPHSTLSIFRPGSVHPSATLFDAFELLEGGEKDKWVKGRAKKCEEKLRTVREKGEMATAVDGLIDAASREWEPWWQKRLLEVSHTLSNLVRKKLTF
jgi:vacuolar protein sorting-associated protein 16